MDLKMSETKASPKKRPTEITVICILGLIGALITIPIIFSPTIMQQLPNWYPPYLGFSALVGFACMVGFWFMKKWAVYVYAGLAIINQVILLSMGSWNIFGLLIPAIIVFFTAKNLSKMT